VPRAVRLVTVADVAAPADPGDLAVSVRHEAVVDDGRRIVLQDGRGFTESLRGPGADRVDVWTSTSEDDLARTARVVVGPDEPYGDLTQADMEAGHWETLADVLRAQGVQVDADELRRLPHDVELTDALRARLGGG
jgi:hypothetical protein